MSPIDRAEIENDARGGNSGEEIPVSYVEGDIKTRYSRSYLHPNGGDDEWNGYVRVNLDEASHSGPPGWSQMNIIKLGIAQRFGSGNIGDENHSNTIAHLSPSSARDLAENLIKFANKIESPHESESEDA